MFTFHLIPDKHGRVHFDERARRAHFSFHHWLRAFAALVKVAR